MKRILLTLAALGTALTMQAKVVLPGIFGDNMVLQQQSEAQFWGKAAPGKKVTIRPSWSTQGITANVGKDGRWRAAVPTPEAGGPYTIELSDGERLTLRDVLIGEVWLCSGQSNMEMPVHGFPQPARRRFGGGDHPGQGRNADPPLHRQTQHGTHAAGGVRGTMAEAHPRSGRRNQRHGLLLRPLLAERAGRPRGCHRHLLGRHPGRGVDGPRNDVRIQGVRPLVP